MKGLAKWQKDQAFAFGSPIVLTNARFNKLKNGVWYYSFYGQDDTVLGKIKRNGTKLSLSGFGTHNIKDLNQGLGYLCTGGGCDPIWVYRSMKVLPKFKAETLGMRFISNRSISRRPVSKYKKGYVINNVTGRRIKVGGPTWRKIYG